MEEVPEIIPIVRPANSCRKTDCSRDKGALQEIGHEMKQAVYHPFNSPSFIILR